MSGKSPKRRKRVAKWLRIAVVSDLHAHDGPLGDTAPSNYCIHEPTSPMQSLIEFVITNNLSADLLLCPGDLADKAKPPALAHAWSRLQLLALSLKNARLIASTGNHDLDSRYAYNSYDAKGFLQTLDPLYPTKDERLNDQYWSRHFAILHHGPACIVILNSSAFHVQGKNDIREVQEFERGRVSAYTLKGLATALKHSQRKPLNILLCHHHPHQHSEHGLGADDLMLGGRELLNLIGSGSLGMWLVIHGHKHRPFLEKAAGHTLSPFVFSAGSACARLKGELPSIARNQFYLIDLQYDGTSSHNQLLGRFQAWDWYPGHGWVPAQPRSGLPAQGGFGWQGNIVKLATGVARAVRQSATKRLTWEELVLRFSQLAFLMPREIDLLEQQLLQKSISIRTESGTNLPHTLEVTTDVH